MLVFDFGGAIKVLKAGGRVMRSGWNGKGMWIGLQPADEAMSKPYLYISTPDGSRVPWVASQMDVLAEDWQEG